LTSGFRPRADRIVVIGGGILGCATAYRLARRGAEVTLCERAELGAGASGKSGAWINAHQSKLPQHYFEISRLSTLAWRELEQEVDGIRVRWGGRLEWSRDAEAGDALRAAAAKQQGWGYPMELVDEARIQKLVPPLIVDPGLAAAAFAPLEGAVEPIEALGALAAAASALGADIRLRTEVRGIDLAGGRVSAVRTDSDVIGADAVVVTGGVDTSTIAGWLGVRIPLRPAPGVLAYTAGPAPNLPAIVAGPDVFVIPHPSGRHVMGRGFVGQPVYSRDRPASEQVEAEAVFQMARSRFTTMAHAKLDDITVGWRPLPTDGHPIIGFVRSVPGLYPMVTHSGFTLAATLSRLAAIEILDGVSVDLLRPYRPERFE
jgi:glycine/D-amino acid oxidase-like deaminating enzyme